jgi:hypothetical protein
VIQSYPKKGKTAELAGSAARDEDWTTLLIIDGRRAFKAAGCKKVHGIF